MIINWFKVSMYVAIVVTCFGAGWFTSEKIRVVPIKADLKVAESQVVQLSDINESNTSICNDRMVKSDILIKNMEIRLKKKGSTCDEALKILALDGGRNEKVSETGSDPILDMLNSLYPRVRTDKSSN